MDNLPDLSTAPFLTIAIPTYNRSACLEQRLLEIRQQYDNRLVVLISDNASTDNTETVVKAYQPQMPYVHYHKNERNVGFDGNILQLYKLVKTRYIWFLGDDDALLPDSIQRVLANLVDYAPAVAILSFEDGDNVLKKKTLVAPPQDFVYNHVSELPDVRLVFNAVFISVVVVEHFPGVDLDALQKHTGNGIIHISLILFILSQRFRLCWLTTPVVRREPAYAGSSDVDVLKLFHLNPYAAVNIPGHVFDVALFKKAIVSDLSSFKTLMASKSGLMGYHYIRPLRRASIKEAWRVWGMSSLALISRLALASLAPRHGMRLYYFLKLIGEFGWSRGPRRYRQWVEQMATGNPRPTNLA